MTAMVSNQTRIGCLVATTVLGKSAKPFQREVERLLRNNGPEWTSTRMKAIWTAANHLRNGNPKLAIAVYQENSISYHKGDGTPKGPFRPVVRQYVEAQRPSVVRRYAAVLRFYTTLVLPELSERQSKKALSSITSPTKRVGGYDDLPEYAREWGSRLASAGRMLGFHLAVHQTPYWKLAPNTYRYSRCVLSKEDRGVPLRSLAMSLLTEGYVPSGLEGYDPFPALRRSVKRSPVTPDEGVAGRIGIIQEQGAKARVVAMPSARLQYSFIPLHEYLVKLDGLLPSSVMKDQVKAIYGLAAHMANGRPAFSRDLSSATDRFPRAISMEMLIGMGMPVYARAIDEVSSRGWKSPWGDISYAVGQPMGLYGSFPVFHLSNQMVAEYSMQIAASKGGHLDTFLNGTCFYVLGDDIVFSDQRVADTYTSVMEAWGLTIAKEKSYDGQLTEFAGFVVTRAHGEPFAFRPYKPPAGSEMTNPVDFLAAMGTKARVVNPDWAEVVDLFSRTWADRAPDLSPYLHMERDEPQSPWDSAALDNEFELLSSRYPQSVPDLDPSVEYSSGRVHTASGDTFTIIGLERDRSKDRPRITLETSREKLGQQPKHPRRRPNPLEGDPLLQAQAAKSEPPFTRWDMLKKIEAAAYNRAARSNKVDAPDSVKKSPLQDPPPRKRRHR